MALERPIPSRLTLLRLRNQERLYRSIKKTVEDARNATIQRIRAIIPKLEIARKSVYDELGRVSLILKAAVSRMGIEEYGKLSEVIKPSVDVEFIDITMEGLKFRGLEFRGVLSPNYGIYAIPPELDSALYGIYSNFKVISEMMNLENLFYTLLARIREYQRMVNAIDNVLLPRIMDNSRFVRLKLDEDEREEFVRRIVISKLLEAMGR
ncbi:V-type ATP synthase subunit D [Vulcanisaeta souniana]|uniref:V-type ATP synthase subunit D n=1 Tax=Vulcanisaeta souniana JCM 11219 TaxID=1293586 RepID=A0A830E7U1_9CREN|nr:V-type ATP synthase subunit D [Vulcanisaeta souniana]BDR93183.1 V-type ATP synthase subunit D [Vulcanisaeta souniana JCM 11219]GGI78252.1 V-type ATP synthase subunit D [Vulcanisaeta souniana JCM 11219]